jgi:uncharacterized protein YegP (UPF0339 family)
LPGAKFEVFQDNSRCFRFRVVQHGEVVYVSEPFPNRHDCINEIELLRKELKLIADAGYEDRIEKAQILMSRLKAEEFQLDIGRPIELGGEIIAQKTRGGVIVLYEVLE